MFGLHKSFSVAEGLAALEVKGGSGGRRRGSHWKGLEGYV